MDPNLSTRASVAVWRGRSVETGAPEDPEAGDTLNHQFHFGDDDTEPFNEDGTFNPHFEHFCRTEHIYEEPGVYIATVSVTDKHLEDQGREVRSLARVTQKVAIDVDGVPPGTVFCRSGAGAIPDPGTLSDTLTVALTAPIQDLDVRLAGSWRLAVTDNVAVDAGTLDEWCLVAAVP